MGICQCASDALLLLTAFVPGVAFAQTKETQDTNESRLATLKYLYSLQDPSGGFYADANHPTIDGMPGIPSLKATNAVVKAIKYLKGTVPNKEKVEDFVSKCFKEWPSRPVRAHDPKGVMKPVPLVRRGSTVCSLTDRVAANSTEKRVIPRRPLASWLYWNCKCPRRSLIWPFATSFLLETSMTKELRPLPSRLGA